MLVLESCQFYLFITFSCSIWFHDSLWRIQLLACAFPFSYWSVPRSTIYFRQHALLICYPVFPQGKISNTRRACCTLGKS
ncbi:hypothetical protein BDA96_05G023100 [Sorghum bicolor]|uniref:Uncharacterized protein n=1 Tax=Sorghum bicolor TaxID=4558 RepID=A0A921QVD8_SORBI|nr:hypothetical protein BDA96_05G023100 [Sorghum bicolor]